MKLISIARKTIIEAWRDRQLTWIYLLFPTMLILIYYSAYGQAASMANLLTLLVDNRDAGELGSQLVQALREATYEGQPVFTVEEIANRRQAEILLEEGKAALLLTIPSDFSTAFGRPAAGPQIELLGDSLTDTYAFSRSFLGEFLSRFSDAQVGWTKPLPVTYEFLPNTGKMSDFQYSIPGLLVFGVAFGMITSALVLVRESSSGTLQRIRLSGASSIQILGGVTLANLILMVVQVLISVGAALVCGLRAPGSIPLAMGMVLIFGLGATGCGFIAASFSKNEGEATAISTAMLAPMAFLSGAVFPLPKATLFMLAGHVVQVYDIFPSAHATQAMIRVLLYGDGLSSLVYECVMLVILSAAYLGAGVWLYQRNVLNHA
jgi:ABC-2 type transport system permease protein